MSDDDYSAFTKQLKEDGPEAVRRKLSSPEHYKPEKRALAQGYLDSLTLASMRAETRSAHRAAWTAAIAAVIAAMAAIMVPVITALNYGP